MRVKQESSGFILIEKFDEHFKTGKLRKFGIFYSADIQIENSINL